MPIRIAKNAPQWLAELEAARNHCDQVTSDPAATEKDKKQVEKQFKAAQSKYNQAAIKTALETMFSGGVKSKSTKCAYCETHIESKKGQDIEHFYPKAIYWWKTFEWENLLIACQTCNEEFNDLRSSDGKGRNLVKQRQASVIGWIALALLIQQETDPVKSQALKNKFQQLCHSQTPYAAFARAIYATIG